MTDPKRALLVTHHAPDLDACGAVWLLKRFAPELYANAAVTFVDAGEVLTESQAVDLGFTMEQVIHVDTGQGKFDHHQPEKALLPISASSLVFEDLCHHAPHLQADSALRQLVEFITQIDHFGEVSWPDAGNFRYGYMMHELLSGYEHLQLRDDDSQLEFAHTMLDSAYAQQTQLLKAAEVLAEKGVEFVIQSGKAMAVETGNDEVLRLGQKQGFVLVVKKDPKEGYIRIKARPDSDIDLRSLHTAILAADTQGTWYYHFSGKMLLNSSRKSARHAPSSLSLAQVVTLIKQLYG